MTAFMLLVLGIKAMILTDRDSYRGRISRENKFITDSNKKNSYNFVAFQAKG